MSRRPLTLAALATLTVLTLLVAPVGPSRAEPRAGSRETPTGPVLLPNREAEVLALLRPYAMGREVVPGWSIGNVGIDRQVIRIELVGTELRGTATLRHPDTLPGAAIRTRNFAIVFEPEQLPRELRAALVTAVRANDEAPLWSLPTSNTDAELEGPIVVGFALLFLLAAVVHHARRGPRWLAPGLLAVSLLGLGLRLVVPVEVEMNAWPYSRIVPVAQWLYDGLWFRQAMQALGARVTLVDLIFRVNLVLAVLTVPVLFAHARALLEDDRAALAAALLLATLPMHLRFSRSDVAFVQSLLASSLTFVALYGATTSPSRAWRIFCQLALPGMCLVTYLTRPENSVFMLLDLGALAVTAWGTGIPRARAAWVAFLLLVPAGVAVHQHLLPMFGDQVRDGLDPGTVWNAFGLLFDLRLNTLLNPTITPPYLAPLAALGAYALVKRGQRRKAVFLVAWLGAFFVVQSYVVSDNPEMQARYHLHLVTPFVLLAASSVPFLLERSRAGVAGLAAATLAVPAVYLPFERRVDFHEMQEFAFLRHATTRIPDDCTVLEFRGSVDPHEGGRQYDSKLERFAWRLLDGRSARRYRVVTADRFAAPARRTDAFDVLAPDAATLLDAPAACTMVYLGLACATQRPGDVPRAPVCERIEETPGLEAVAERTVRGRIYDSNVLGHPYLRDYGRERPTLAPDEPVRLRLYRVRGDAR